MSDEECPNCGAQFPANDSWANSAISILVAAPAVRDLVTQLRCPKCGHVFSERETRHLRSSWTMGTMIFLVLLGACVLIWAVY